MNADEVHKCSPRLVPRELAYSGPIWSSIGGSIELLKLSEGASLPTIVDPFAMSFISMEGSVSLTWTVEDKYPFLNHDPVGSGTRLSTLAFLN